MYFYLLTNSVSKIKVKNLHVEKFLIQFYELGFLVSDKLKYIISSVFS